ncbi:MAG TPA: hypothetical protein VLL04_10720, partial [Rhizomicrobium sp.]|nr:hypothetical protein [Rhizomicrobium sp.]
MALREFGTQFPDDPIALHHGPAGNDTGLESFHTIQPEDVEPNNTPKIVGAIAVALMVSAAGVALYASHGSSSSQPKQVVAAAAPVTPPPAAAPVDANMPASAPAAAPEPVAPVKAAATEPSAPKPAPVRSASSAKASSSSRGASSAP